MPTHDSVQLLGVGAARFASEAAHNNATWLALRKCQEAVPTNKFGPWKCHGAAYDEYLSRLPPAPTAAILSSQEPPPPEPTITPTISPTPPEEDDAFYNPPPASIWAPAMFPTDSDLPSPVVRAADPMPPPARASAAIS